MNEIANQHNDLINLPLRRFNASEIDILLALCYKCQDEGTNKITLSFDKIRQLTHYQAKDEKQFLKAIESTNEKLLGLNMKIGNDKDWVQFVLFPTFKVSSTEQTLTVQVHEQFAYLLNDLTGNYTSLELQESASLRSSYAKGIYKKLRKERDRGKWIVTLKDFRTYLDVPKSYMTSDINKRVIKPSIDELTPFFSGLKCESYYDKQKKGRGRPSVAGYIFSFKPQPHEKEEKQPSVEQIADKTGWQATGKYCPRCYKEIYQRLQENENGQYYQLGHPDFKTGGCDYLTNDFSHLLTKRQVDELNRPEPTAKEKENKKKLSGMFKNLFG